MAESVPSRPLRLLLVDDHAVMRAGLANMLNAREEFDVVAEADSGESALVLHQQHDPDVTLLDIAMPGMGGLECLRRLKQQSPDASVLMLSSSELEHDMHHAIDLGADGYITKTAMPPELVASILAVGRGELCISEEVSRRIKSYSATPQLTSREIEVLGLLRKGMSNPDIGLILGIKPRTAKAHVAAILLKLAAQDRAEAVARGFELGLLRP
ncbi:response regulator [Stieleria magnilauensis]|uniref:Response regulator protein VraR n=1 Tax=Stieleria magnilauensis TaxID=2527963 RepID=A0ABX5XLU5_9BACT|nr:Response regulator protein VraR [Planctomycetes bacterium TBK1r]